MAVGLADAQSGSQGEAAMKTRIQGLMAVAVLALAVVAMPIKALAHDGWHHDHGRHLGWYKHHGGDAWGREGWHHHQDWDDDDGYEDQGYGGPGYGYGGLSYGGQPYGGYYGGYGYGSPPPAALPLGGSYLSGPVYGSGGYGYAPNAGKWMLRQQKASQRLSANQALYQAAMAQGNYALARKAAAHIQKQSNILNGANSLLGGAPGYSTYGQPVYGAAPYYAQPGYGTLAPGASPLGSVLQMLGY
jgi:hypothetical protein